MRVEASPDRPSITTDLTVRDLIEYIAKQLVDEPDQVRVEEVDRGEDLAIELRVAEDDLGKVIGKEGRTARAMRTLMSVVSAQRGRRIVLEILE